MTDTDATAALFVIHILKPNLENVQKLQYWIFNHQKLDSYLCFAQCCESYGRRLQTSADWA